MKARTVNMWPYEAVEPGTSIENDDPCVCSLVDEEIKTLLDERRANFYPGVVGCDQLPNGYVFWFLRTDEWLQKVVDFARFESKCCAFLDFGIGFRATGDLISLRISSAEGHATQMYDALRRDFSS